MLTKFANVICMLFCLRNKGKIRHVFATNQGVTLFLARARASMAGKQKKKITIEKDKFVSGPSSASPYPRARKHPIVFLPVIHSCGLIHSEAFQRITPSECLLSLSVVTAELRYVLSGCFTSPNWRQCRHFCLFIRATSRSNHLPMSKQRQQLLHSFYQTKLTGL